jgi:DNA-directed RNA polymerase beta' subunit
MVNCLLYLTESFQDVTELRERSSTLFTDMTVKRLVHSHELVKNQPLEKWHHLFCRWHQIRPETLGWRLRFRINQEALYEYKVSLKMIADAIHAEYQDAVVLYTPDWVGILDVFVDEDCFQGEIEEKVEELIQDDVSIHEVDSDEEDEPTVFFPVAIRQVENREDVVPSDMNRVIRMEDRILPALLEIRVCGITGIRDIFFEKRKQEWVVTTEGSNLRGLFRDPLIDKVRTMSNDMWEIYDVFGIEAARQFLIEEYMDIVSSDGTFVNPSNVELLVDIMVYTGTIISISRYGQKKVGCGPMAKASFEESLENFMKAGINGERETTTGVSASIMLGKMPNIGTGVFDLMVDLEKLTKIEEPIMSAPEASTASVFSSKAAFF